MKKIFFLFCIITFATLSLTALDWDKKTTMVNDGDKHTISFELDNLNDKDL